MANEESTMGRGGYIKEIDTHTPIRTHNTQCN